MIFEIDNVLLSGEIFDIAFCCDIAACKGICCVEGNSGAPLEHFEVEILKAEYERFKPYMKPEGIAEIERSGVMVIDEDGDLTTPLVAGAECAYSIESGETTLCAIEKAFLNGKTSFKKPVSCHLYPIRLQKFSNGTLAMNYHKWDVCDAALVLGEKKGIPLYKALREPLIRRFGEEFFEQICIMGDYIRGTK